jgi:hypothetical protein
VALEVQNPDDPSADDGQVSQLTDDDFARLYITLQDLRGDWGYTHLAAPLTFIVILSLTAVPEGRQRCCHHGQEASV